MNQPTENINNTPASQQIVPNKKMKECKICGNVIAKSAKRCPFCGAKNNRPIIYHSGFRILCIFVALVILVNTGIFVKNNAYIKPTSYNIMDYQELIEDCMYDEEAAKEKYIGEHYSISGPCNPFKEESWGIHRYFKYTHYSSEYITTIDWELSVIAEFKSVNAKNNKPLAHYGENVTVKGVITNLTYDYAGKGVSIHLTVYESYVN